jgi:hypothetical protein
MAYFFYMCRRKGSTWMNGSQIFQNSGSHKNILGGKMVTLSNSTTVDSQILDPNLQNLVYRATWAPELRTSE